MWWYLVPILTGVCAISVIAALLRRARPRLVLIDVSTIAKERDAQRKQEIIFGRAERLFLDSVRRVRAFWKPRGVWLVKTFRIIYNHALDLEKRYRHVGAASGAAFERARQCVLDGAELAKAGKVREAEQKYIEAVSIYPKCSQAYEELGRMYVREKQWGEALEAFQFLLRLDPKDASAHANLGELSLAKGEPTEAVGHFEAAVAIKPANPQLQMLLLEAAIAAAQKEKALMVFARLKDLSPQNPRIPELVEKIKAM